jgi:hypothetical protein
MPNNTPPHCIVMKSKDVILIQLHKFLKHNLFPTGLVKISAKFSSPGMRNHNITLINIIQEEMISNINVFRSLRNTSIFNNFDSSIALSHKIRGAQTQYDNLSG